jgi:anti-anti-sigma factor
MDLVCSIHDGEDAVVVTARGEIDLASAGEFARCLETAIARAPEAIELNLAEVTFIDVKGWRVLEGVRNACGARGLAFALTAVHAHIRRVLDLLDRS